MMSFKFVFSSIDNGYSGKDRQILRETETIYVKVIQLQLHFQEILMLVTGTGQKNNSFSLLYYFVNVSKI